jgi:shikimate dehydrogenase
MRLFGLIGYPLGHSFSQKYFSEKFRAEGLEDHCYELFPLKTVDLLPELINRNPDLCGLNVTIPYKVDVIRYLDETDSLAEAIGAVNVIKIIRKEGSVRQKGFNTDAPAFMQTIRNIGDVKLKKALVLGTGGASASVCHVLGQMGFDVTRVSRNASGGNLCYNEVTAEVLQGSGVIVNTTPVGMYPATGECPPIDYQCLLPQQILYDLIYNPLKTEFLIRGEKQGCRIFNGLDMLHLQAELAWKIWNKD